MPKQEKSTLLVVALLILVASWLVFQDGAGWVDDVLLTEYPLRAAYADGLARGKLPFWTPHILGGYPLLASGEPGALYPPNLVLHLLTPTAIALTLFLVFHLFWAALGTFVLARRWFLSKSAATGASLLFLLSGFLSTALRQPNLIASVSWLPWLLLCADRVLGPGSPLELHRDAALFALTSGMVFLTGIPSGAMLGLAATAAYAGCFLVARRTSAASVLWLALGAVTGVVLASVQLLPGLELAGLAAQVPLDQSGSSARCLSRAATYLLPIHWPGLFTFASALLAGFGLDRFADKSASRGTRIALCLVTLGLMALALGAYSEPRTSGPGWVNAIAGMQQTPDSASFLRANTGVYRIRPEQEESTSDALAGESLSADRSLLYGLFSASGSTRLIPDHYARYLMDMTPQKLNLLGVKYTLVPLARPGVDGPVEGFRDDFMYDPLDDVMPIPLVMAAGVEIEWYLSDSADWEDQEPVALLTFMTEETVDIMEYLLSAGLHTADWAYEQSDMQGHVKHDKTILARTFPARSSSPPQAFYGSVYRTDIKLPYAVLIHGIKIESMADPERVHIERVTLMDQGGTRYLFSHLSGMSDHTLAYRSDDVAIFENHDVLPRVFLTYDVREAADDSEASAMLSSPAFDPRRQVVLLGKQIPAVTAPASGTESVELQLYASDRVVVQVHAPAEGYLVLTDTWYPGWRALVDGKETPVLRADLAFRAVLVPAGEHSIEFTYRPTALRTGFWISCATLAVILCLSMRERSRRY